jgi:hypothetical protein
MEEDTLYLAAVVDVEAERRMVDRGMETSGGWFC